MVIEETKSLNFWLQATMWKRPTKMVTKQRQRICVSFIILCCSLTAFFAPCTAIGAEKPIAQNLREEFLDGPMAGVDEIVFACRQLNYDGHWYANFGYYAENADRKAYRAMGRLCKLNLRTGEVTVLLDDPKGTVRDPQVYYDGSKILFSYRKSGTENFNLYEINTDGSGLKQLTDGPYDDIEPTYLPDDSIVFCSSRCHRWVGCWLTHVAILYRCDADGSNIRPISSNSEHENTPWPLPDGRVLYQRWEYVDRSQVHYHHLWTINPDGTGQMIYYGNFHPGTVMIDAKPIPNTEKVLAVFSPGHGRREHEGQITIVTPKAGPDQKASAHPVSRMSNYRDPYPFSDDCFLMAQGTRLLVMNGKGQTAEIYHLPTDLTKAGVQCHEPRPLRQRPRERVIPPRVDLQQATGQLVLQDIYQGRRMEGIKRGEIKKLLVMEPLPAPIHYTGGMEPVSYGGTFMLERILGIVPVEPDGSAYMEVPAMRSLFFVALDENNNSVKRMQSFLTVSPGEKTSCVGCHEQRTRTPVNPGRSTLQSLNRPPSKIEPIPDVPGVFDFPRDIQPILDKHCIRCHGYEATEENGPRAGSVLLSGDRGPIYSHSYYTLTIRRQFADGRNRPKSNLPPRSIGSGVSSLMKKLDGSHYSVKVTPHERDMIRFWIEAGSPYPGTYAALGCGMIGGYGENKQDQSDRQWPSTIAAAEVIKSRCANCHNRFLPLPLALSDNRNVPPWHGQPGYVPRHLVFNLTRPEKSLILLAPLSSKAGGYGLCRPKGKAGEPNEPTTPFADTNDADYQKILALCIAGKKHLDKIKRFDMPDFRPRRSYVREMKRYGILSRDLPEDAKIDIYVTEQAYWRSLWYKPDDDIDAIR
jgi:hypothetical protein